MTLKGNIDLPEDVAVRVTDVWKRYRTGAIKGKTLVREAQSLIARIKGNEDPNQKIAMDRAHLESSDTARNEWFWAVRGVDFEIKKGEVVVILGRNGAGKSTLLQMLCQVTEADRGEIMYRGRFASLLQAGVGFHDELTGRENIFLNGAILGLTRDEIIDRIPAIAEFSEIPQFLDTPVKRYSSGMRGRLGFSVAAHLGAEIMILDEVFATGDRPYRFKCIDKVKQLAQEGTTIILVTHMVELLGDVVSRAIFMEDGKIKYDGDKDLALSYYLGEMAVPGDLEKGEDVKASQEQEEAALSEDAEIVKSRNVLKIEAASLDPVGYQGLGELHVTESSSHSGFESAYTCFRTAESLANLQGDAEKSRAAKAGAEKALDLMAPFEDLPYFRSVFADRTREALLEWSSSMDGDVVVQAVHFTRGLSRRLPEFQWIEAHPDADGYGYAKQISEGLRPDFLLCLAPAPRKGGESLEEWVSDLFDQGIERIVLMGMCQTLEDYAHSRWILDSVNGKSDGNDFDIAVEAAREGWQTRDHFGEIKEFSEKRGWRFDSKPLRGDAMETLSSIVWGQSNSSSTGGAAFNRVARSGIEHGLSRSLYQVEEPVFELCLVERV